MTRLVLVALGSVLVACGATEVRLVAPFPEDTTFVAAAWLDADDQVLFASPLLAVDRDDPFVELEAEADDAERIALLAWSDAALTTVNRPDAATLAATPLTRATGSDARLPTPSWVGASMARDGLVVAEDVALEVGLTASWLMPCPTVLAPDALNHADVRCLVRPCGAPPVQEGCRLKVDLTECGQGFFEVALSGQGTIEPVSDDASECRLEAPLAPAAFALDCRRCRIDLYSTAADAEPFVDVETFTLRPPKADATFERYVFGVVADVVVLEDFVVAATLDDVDGEADCRDGPRRSTLHWFDVSTSTLVRTSTLAGCVRRLARDPVVGGVVALDVTEVEMSLVQVDPTGREIGRIRFDELRGPPEREMRGLIAVDDPPRVVGVSEAFQGDVALLTFVALDPLRHLSTHELREADGHALGFAPPFLVVGQDGRADLWDVELERREAEVRFGTGEGIWNDPDVIVPLAAPTRVLGLNLGELGGIHSSDLEGTVVAARWYPTHGVATTGVDIPGVERALLGVTDLADPNEAGLVLFDTQHSRFLPPRISIGRGPVIGLALARDGAYWGALAADGVVFRAVLR